MEETELKKEMADEVTPANEEVLVKMQEQEQQEQQETVIAETTEQQPEMMNFATFSNVAVNLYCSLSDLVYKRVKKGQLPPAWSDESKELLNNAAANVLQGYNVPMSPIWQLVTTVVAVEVLRYATPKLIDQNIDENA